MPGKQALQRRLRDRRVREDEAEHGGHVGRHHAGALAEAVDDDGHAADLGGARGELGVGVGGHDGARGGFEGVRLHRLGEIAQQMDEATCVQRLADHPRGGQVYLLCAAANGAGGGLRRHARGVAALLAGEGIGVAGVDDQGARLAVLEARPAPQHRRRAGLGAGQHAGHDRAGLERRQHQIGAALVADAGLAGRQPHAGHRRHVGQARGRKR